MHAKLAESLIEKRGRECAPKSRTKGYIAL